MFFVAGIHNKMQNLGMRGQCSCPCCAHQGTMHLSHSYLTPHLFFIPTFRFRSQFLLTCPQCASVMALDNALGERLRRNPSVVVSAAEMRVTQNNHRSFCPQCGTALAAGDRFCKNCGSSQ